MCLHWCEIEPHWVLTRHSSSSFRSPDRHESHLWVQLSSHSSHRPAGSCSYQQLVWTNKTNIDEPIIIIIINNNNHSPFSMTPVAHWDPPLSWSVCSSCSPKLSHGRTFLPQESSWAEPAHSPSWPWSPAVLQWSFQTLPVCPWDSPDHLGAVCAASLPCYELPSQSHSRPGAPGGESATHGSLSPAWL